LAGAVPRDGAPCTVMPASVSRWARTLAAFIVGSGKRTEYSTSGCTRASCTAIGVTGATNPSDR